MTFWLNQSFLQVSFLGDSSVSLDSDDPVLFFFLVWYVTSSLVSVLTLSGTPIYPSSRTY